MSATDRLSDYLDQIKQGSADALTFVDGMDEDQFMSDLRTQRAVVMSLMIVGEAASRIVAEHRVHRNKGTKSTTEKSAVFLFQKG